MRPQRWPHTRYDQTQFSNVIERNIDSVFLGRRQRKKEEKREGWKEGRKEREKVGKKGRKEEGKNEG